MIQIRDAGLAPADPEFIVAAFDSSLPVLAETGNAGQWGTIPFSEKDGFLQATRDDVAQSGRFRLTGEGERQRIFIAQLEEDGKKIDADDGLYRWTDATGQMFLSVGAVTVRDDDFADHILDLDILAPHITMAKAAGGFIYLDVLITDHRIDSVRRKGSGLAMLEYVVAYARQNGKRTVFVDCWTGGTGKLVQYYEAAGFKPVEDFQVEKKNGSVWPGQLFRLDLD